MTTSKRFDFSDHPDFVISIEYNESFFVFHFHRLSKIRRGTIKYLVNYMPKLKEFAMDMGYSNVHAGVPIEDRQINRLVTYIGFKFIGSNREQGINVFEL